MTYNGVLPLIRQNQLFVCCHFENYMKWVYKPSNQVILKSAL